MPTCFDTNCEHHSKIEPFCTLNECPLEYGDDPKVVLFVDENGKMLVGCDKECTLYYKINLNRVCIKFNQPLYKSQLVCSKCKDYLLVQLENNNVNINGEVND